MDGLSYIDDLLERQAESLLFDIDDDCMAYEDNDLTYLDFENDDLV